jgi:hypothetical protein
MEEDVGVGTSAARLVSFGLALFVLAEVACYPWLADLIGRVFLGHPEGPEGPVIVFQVLRVLPGAVLFSAVALSAILSLALSPKRRFWWVVGSTLLLNLGLLVLSVALYFRN